jgi:hypothetical protein
MPPRYLGAEMMLAKFDPIRERQVWLEYGLKVETEFAPDAIASTAQPGYASQIANSLIEAYWVGLSDQVRPTLEQIIAWMEAEAEPSAAVYGWQRTLGLCKWLSRNDSGQDHFAAAINARWQNWQQETTGKLAGNREERQEVLSQCMAMALTANVPALGVKLYEAAKVRRTSKDQAPLLQFGRWACGHLVQGGHRDATFIAKGADMLRASLLPNFFWGGNRTEPALWLKAIYWDSGVAQTPEQAIARAYDSMPGVERPDFVPR